MPTFKIQPSDRSFLAGITAADATAVLRFVQRLECKQADVSRDNHYAFSIRMDSSGRWRIYQKHAESRW